MAARLGLSEQVSSSFEHSVKHRPGELSREGILLAWVVAAQERQALVKVSYTAMAKLRARLGDGSTVCLVGLQEGIEGDLAERHYDAALWKKLQFLN